MARSFSLVDFKCAEAQFFLEQIPCAGFNFFGVRCFVAAFAAAARSVATSMEGSLARVSGFRTWYDRWQDRLKNDSLSRFFRTFRNANQHLGDNAVGGGSSGPGGTVLYWFHATADVPTAPEEDVYVASRAHFVTILSMVYDCYVSFGPHVDARQRYTSEYFLGLNRSIEDAEEELGFPRGWTDIGRPDLIEYRWQAIRDHVCGCEIDQLFEQYLGKVSPAPARLPHLELGPKDIASS
jgi:hypothetical protein